MLEKMDTRLDLDPSGFFDEFHPRVFRFIASMSGAPGSDVDDLVQETLLYAWSNRGQFLHQASLMTWILSIARNRVRMRGRSLARKRALETALEAIDRERIPSDVLRSEETARAVRRALDALDPIHADLLIQRYFNGLAVREIAATAGETEKAIESRLHRARAALRDQLAKGEDDEL